MISKRFIVTSLIFFLVGGVLALLMRIQLAQPENAFLGPEVYNRIFAMYGTIRMFFFAVPVMVMVESLEPRTGVLAAAEAVDVRRAADPERGHDLIRHFACAACHTVPNVVGANGMVGPPLSGISDRKYTAGIMTNTRENLIRWIMNLHEIDPLSAMPDLGVNRNQAEDIAALYQVTDDE